MFKLFAELIACHFDASEQLAASEADLLGERKTAELREQFVAVLGHDLRNPLASIAAGAKVLRKTQQTDQAGEILDLMQSAVARMAGLINNVLDFARGRLGGGLSVNRDGAASPEPVRRQVFAELHASYPDRVIEIEFALADPVDCDRARLAQLFSNLLSNALTYGAADRPIRVQAKTNLECFELSVSNFGKPIPAAALERLFQPFSRGAVRLNKRDLAWACILLPRSPANIAEH